MVFAKDCIVGKSYQYIGDDDLKKNLKLYNLKEKEIINNVEVSNKGPSYKLTFSNLRFYFNPDEELKEIYSMEDYYQEEKQIYQSIRNKRIELENLENKLLDNKKKKEHYCLIVSGHDWDCEYESGPYGERYFFCKICQVIR